MPIWKKTKDGYGLGKEDVDDGIGLGNREGWDG